MSRVIGSVTRAALNAQETGEAFVILLTLDHDSLAEPMRVCSDAVDVTSRGDLYVAYPFDLSLPDDEDNKSPRCANWTAPRR